MNKILYVCCFLFIFSNCTPDEVGQDVPPAENTEPDAEITAVIDDLYTSINYDGEEGPDWELLRSCFLEGAEMIPVTDSSLTRMSVDDFIDLYGGQIESGIIRTAREYEIHQTGEQFAGIAQVFSTYETEVVTVEDTLGKRGINSIQLLKSDGEWKIASIIWFDENEEHKIPAAYLK